MKPVHRKEHCGQCSLFSKAPHGHSQMLREVLLGRACLMSPKFVWKA